MDEKILDYILKEFEIEAKEATSRFELGNESLVANFFYGYALIDAEAILSSIITDLKLRLKNNSEF